MKFNKSVTSSRRKNRKAHFRAPPHEKRLRMSSALSKELRAGHGFRSIPVTKGDTVIVMVGKFKGKRGLVTCVRRSLYRVFVEGCEVQKANGQKVPVGIDASNLCIVKLGTSYGRSKVIERKSLASKAAEEEALKRKDKST
jgi:large subunit ribosomal protein L26e